MFKRVIEIFKEITAIPRGSGNMKQIADYCVDFAERNSLRFIRDNADNIIIFKNGTEDKEPIILQGHLDMVCQQTADSDHNFLKNGPEIIIDGDFIKANKTTLGADNGIAIAMIMAILESDEINHPPIEVVFTTDEEIGMIGALQLDATILKGKRMINLDSEDDDTVTVSCAGGSEFQFTLPIETEEFVGDEITITLNGLMGGHSGVEIDKGRVNANILAGRLLNHLNYKCDFRICEINGGDKSNAITPQCVIRLVANDDFINSATKYLDLIKNEISAREPDFAFEISKANNKTPAFTNDLTEKIIFLLLCSPNGIVDMSAEIKGLVETSLNLGIFKTEKNAVIANFSLRSNKSTALKFLEEKLSALARAIDAETKTFGHYPPWEYKANSELEKLYIDCFVKHYGFAPKIEAIHAGLECGVFDSKISGLSAIAVGPQMFDVHTVNERLSISSTEKFFELLITVLEKLQ